MTPEQAVAGRLHCQTYRQLTQLKAVLDAFGKKLATKEQDTAIAALRTTTGEQS